jgi:hypothetical protein
MDTHHLCWDASRHWRSRNNRCVPKNSMILLLVGSEKQFPIFRDMDRLRLERVSLCVCLVKRIWRIAVASSWCTDQDFQSSHSVTQCIFLCCAHA